MKKEKTVNFICYLLLSVLCVYVIYLFTYFTQHSTFLFGDDGYSSLYPYIEEGMFDCLKFKLHGDGYMGLFLTKFFSFGLPVKLGIHPADFIGIPHGIIKGIFASLTFLSVSNFVNLFRKSAFLYLLSFILLIFLFFDTAVSVTTTVIMCSYNFYRYFFSLFFMGIFLNFVLKSILFKEDKTDIKKLIFASLSGFIAATSVEINIFSLLMFVLLIFLYSVIVNKFTKNKKISDSFEIKLNKNFYIPSVFVILAVSAVTLSKTGFQNMAAARGLGSAVITPDLIISFVNQFIDIYFLHNSVLIILFIVLLAVSLFFAVKNREIKTIIIPLFFVFSVLTSLSSLILLEKTNGGDFWLNHPNIIFLFRMLLVFPLLYFISYIYKNLKFLHNSIAETVIFSLIICFSLKAFTDMQFQNIVPQVDINLKRKAYIAEKMLRFYYLQNRRPVLPEDIMHSVDFGSWEDANTEDYNTENKINSSYYPRIYKNNISAQFGYEYDNDAIKKFYGAGGIFSREELENIQFSRLFNEDFVLNKDYTTKELYDLIQ